MKKHPGFIALLLLLALVACGGEEVATSIPSATVVTTTATVIPATEVAATTATATPTIEPTATQTPSPTVTDTPTTVPTVAATATKRGTATPTVRPSAAPGGNNDEESTAVPTRPAADTAEPPTAESDPEAMTILQKSQEAQDNVQTLTQHQETLLVTGGVTQTQTHDCQRELPSNAYCQIIINVQIEGLTNTTTTTLEMVTLDGVFWARETSEDEWEQLPEDFLQQMGMGDQLQFEFSVDPIYITAAKLIGERELDGVPVYEIQAELDAELYFNEYFNEETAEQILANMDEASLSTTLWISQEDFITYRQEVEMSITMVTGETLTSIAKVTNSDINEPVSIPNPAEE